MGQYKTYSSNANFDNIKQRKDPNVGAGMVADFIGVNRRFINNPVGQQLADRVKDLENTLWPQKALSYFS